MTETCALPVLPEGPTAGDLDAAYLSRGEAVAICDGRRKLAVDTLTAERSLIDLWLETQSPRPWWAVWSR